MEIPSLGIIGNGFIGGAASNAFMHYTNVKIYDKNSAKSTHDLVEVLNQDVLFLAVPTPMKLDGSVDVSIVADAIQTIEDNLPSRVVKPVIIKSTIPPRELGNLMLKHAEKLLVIFSPEFLTERSAAYDYIQSNRFIFGTLNGFEITPEAKIVSKLFSGRFGAVPQYWVPFVVASLVKYFTNVFFCTKLSLMNEYAQICDGWGVEHKDVIDLVMLDPRIGHSHNQVPGHDGKKGFSGSCFIKDINEYIHLAKEMRISPSLAQAAWNKNVEVRGALNLADELKEMKGRAASEEFSIDDVLKLGK